MSANHVPTIRAHLLRPYIETLEARGLPTIRLLDQHGLSVDDHTSPYARIPLDSFIRFTEAAAFWLGDRHIGLKLGSVRRPEHLGALGFMITTALTLRSGLTGFLTWMRGLQESTRIELIEGKTKADYFYRVYGFDPKLVRQDVEFTLASFCNLIRARLGSGWVPFEVHFEHSAFGSVEPYERIFKAPVFFEQAVNKIVIRRSDLDHVNPDAGFVMGPLIEQHLRMLSGEMGENKDLSQRIGLVIARLMGHKPVTLRNVATEIGWSVRSLQRHLLEEGVTFRDLVKAQRRRVVETLLGGQHPSSVTAAAISAGYADGTTLARAYKNWTGTPPSAYSRQKRSTDVSGSHTNGGLQTGGRTFIATNSSITVL